MFLLSTTLPLAVIVSDLLQIMNNLPKTSPAKTVASSLQLSTWLSNKLSTNGSASTVTLLSDSTSEVMSLTITDNEMVLKLLPLWRKSSAANWQPPRTLRIYKNLRFLSMELARIVLSKDWAINLKNIPSTGLKEKVNSRSK